MSEEKQLTLADFQQQVAIFHGYDTWSHLAYARSMTFDKERAYANEASELYADYRFEQGENAGYTRGYSNGLERAKLIDDSMLEAERKAAFEQGKQAGEAKHEKLLSWLKSKSVYTLLRYGVKSPSSSGMDDCEDSDYYDLYNFVNELKQEEE